MQITLEADDITTLWRAPGGHCMPTLADQPIHMIDDWLLSPALHRSFCWWQENPEPKDFFYHLTKGITILALSEDTASLEGVISVYDITAHDAKIGICYQKGIDPIRKVAFTRHVGKWLLAMRGLERVWAITPWPAALDHARMAGCVLHATIPGYWWYKKQWRDVYIIRGDKELLNG